METITPQVNMMPAEGHDAKPFDTRWAAHKGNFRPKNDTKIWDYDSEVMTLAYDDDCALLAAGFGDGNINIYQAFSHRLITPVQRNLREDQVGFAKQCIRFRPNAPMVGSAARSLAHKKPTELLSVDSEGMIYHINPQTGKVTH